MEALPPDRAPLDWIPMRSARPGPGQRVLTAVEEQGGWRVRDEIYPDPDRRHAPETLWRPYPG